MCLRVRAAWPTGAAISAARGSFRGQSGRDIAGMIALNVTALTRLANAVAPRLAAAGDGAIVNLGSIVGLAPEFGLTVYGATKAFVLFLTQGLHAELGAKGVYVQAALPTATHTEFWDRSDRDVNAFPAAMDAEELVDAALVGFDRRETVTIPPLPDAGQWIALEAARQAMLPNFMQPHAAERYRSPGGPEHAKGASGLSDHARPDGESARAMALRRIRTSQSAVGVWRLPASQGSIDRRESGAPL